MRSCTAAVLLVAAAACSHSDRTHQALQDIGQGDPAALERAAIGPWLAESDEILELEPRLDAALRSEYALGLRSADDHARVVRAAAIEWVRQVRRLLGHDGLHTTVRALAEDPDCRGSVIENAVLLDYVDASSGREPSTPRVVGALHGLVQQLACLEMAQSTSLAAAMKLAFDDVVTSLRLDGLDGAIPYVAQAVANPMLLVHEIERRHGDDAPLARWFREYEVALVDGVERYHHPASWHGLWLYDRITGRLRGFRVVEHAPDEARDEAPDEARDAASDENAVELATLYRTVSNARIDDGKCSYVEMIMRGPSRDRRYECLGAACAAGDPTACSTQSGGGGDGPAEHGGGVDLPGMATNDALACIAAQAAHTGGRAQLSCMMEATGRGANPLDRMTKEMTQVSLAGIKGHCDRAQIDDDVLAERTYNTHIKRAEERYQAALDGAANTLSNAIDALAGAQKDRGELDGTNASADDIKKADAKVKAAEDAVNNADKAAAETRRKADEAREKARKEAEEQRKKDKQRAGSGSGSGSGSGTGSGTGSGSDTGSGDDGDDERCVDGESCGCAAMSAQTQAMLDCFKGQVKDEARDPWRGPGGCKDNCDPIDPQTGDGGRACFETLATDGGAELSRACWSARCGPADAGASACCGGATLANGTPMRITGACGAADCSDGVQPTFAGGKCTCGTTGAGMPNGPGMPQGGAAPYFPPGGF
jgi:hypothetical protein